MMLPRFSGRGAKKGHMARRQEGKMGGGFSSLGGWTPLLFIATLSYDWKLILTFVF